MTTTDTPPNLSTEEQELFVKELANSLALSACDRQIADHEKWEQEWRDGTKAEKERLILLDRYVSKLLNRAAKLQAAIKRQSGHLQASRYPQTRMLAKLRSKRTRIVKTISRIVAGRIAERRRSQAYSNLIRMKSNAIHQASPQTSVSGPPDRNLPSPHSYPAREEKVLSGHEKS